VGPEPARGSGLPQFETPTPEPHARLRHAARTKFFLDGIAVGEGGFEAAEKLWPCVLAPLAPPRIRLRASSG